MTIQELIDLLAQLNPNTTVVVWNPSTDDITEIVAIEVLADKRVLISNL